MAGRQKDKELPGQARIFRPVIDPNTGELQTFEIFPPTPSPKVESKEGEE